jgi:hypothetical protein
LKQPIVIIGIPICESKAYILDLFISNLIAIRLHYPDSRIVFAVQSNKAEAEFVKRAGLERYGKVIYWTPEPGKTFWLQNIANAREAIRQYVIGTPFDYLMVCDCDMTYDSNLINLMLAHAEGKDAVFSAYRVRPHGTWGWGTSPSLLSRELLKKIHYRCIVWANKRYMCEDQMLDFDMFLLGAKIARGAYVSNIHHATSDTPLVLDVPIKIHWWRYLMISLPVRFIAIGISQLCHYDFTWAIYKISHVWMRIP